MNKIIAAITNEDIKVFVAEQLNIDTSLNTTEFLDQLESNPDQFSDSEILKFYQNNKSDWDFSWKDLAFDCELMRLITAIKDNTELKETLFYPGIQQVMDHIFRFIDSEDECFSEDIASITKEIINMIKEDSGLVKYLRATQAEDQEECSTLSWFLFWILDTECQKGSEITELMKIIFENNLFISDLLKTWYDGSTKKGYFDFRLILAEDKILRHRIFDFAREKILNFMIDNLYSSCSGILKSHENFRNKFLNRLCNIDFVSRPCVSRPCLTKKAIKYYLQFVLEDPRSTALILLNPEKLQLETNTGLLTNILYDFNKIVILNDSFYSIAQQWLKSSLQKHPELYQKIVLQIQGLLVPKSTQKFAHELLIDTNKIIQEIVKERPDVQIIPSLEQIAAEQIPKPIIYIPNFEAIKECYNRSRSHESVDLHDVLSKLFFSIYTSEMNEVFAEFFISTEAAASQLAESESDRPSKLRKVISEDEETLKLDTNFDDLFLQIFKYFDNTSTASTLLQKELAIKQLEGVSIHILNSIGFKLKLDMSKFSLIYTPRVACLQGG